MKVPQGGRVGNIERKRESVLGIAIHSHRNAWQLSDATTHCFPYYHVNELYFEMIPMVLYKKVGVE